MKYNGNNIILDTDITMTDINNIGHSLSDVINKLQEAINSLESNIKWIYKYGGVGSGNSGGGSENNTPWRYVIELNEVAYPSGKKVNLGTPGKYRFGLQLYKIQGRTFNIKITYDGKRGKNIIERVILPTGNTSLSESLDLQVNGVLSVIINDDEGNTATFNIEYIVNAYDFSFEYVRGDKIPYVPDLGNIYVGDVKDYGLCVKLKTSIAVDIILSSHVIYTDWFGNVQEISLSKGTKEYILPLDISGEYIEYLEDSEGFKKSILNNDNAGMYTATIEPHLILDGNPKEENIKALLLRDNVIPTNIYLKIESDGTLYNNIPENNYDSFYTGSILLYITPFLGALDKGTPYSVNVELKYSGQVSQKISETILDRTKTIISVPAIEVGLYQIDITALRRGEKFTKTYYFYTKSPNENFKWYPTIGELVINPELSYLYSYQQKLHGKDPQQFVGLTNDILISKNSLDIDNTIYRIPKSEKQLENLDCLISMAINFNRINDITKPILTLVSSSENTKEIRLSIYQNHIDFDSKTESKIYLPKDEYHLLSIYKRACYNTQGLTDYEYCVYLDGVFESCFSTIYLTQERWSHILLHPGNYNIRFLEISYFKHTKSLTDSTYNKFSDYYGQPNEYRTYLMDSDILYYYYSYKLTYDPNTISNAFLEAYSFASNMYIDHDTGRIHTDYNTISNIAKNGSGVPVLLVTYRENQITQELENNNTMIPGKAFLKWMEDRYDVTSTSNSDQIKALQKVSVKYSSGNKGDELKDVSHSNSEFYLLLQGTSTMLYGSKNFDLILDTVKNDDDDDNRVYLYTPNFSKDDYSTFLPEKRFTLKADMVDSSHSNNATIGKFVNTVCTKFNDAKQEGEYGNYIKNTLLGFPCLLFICNSYFENSLSISTIDDYYFMGIYSFNLGRDSEYNLGYKDVSVFSEDGKSLLTGGMQVVSVKLGDYQYLPNFGVAEILDNYNWCDFSQWDESILFPINGSELDKSYMFSKMKSNDPNNIALRGNLRETVKAVALAGGHIFENVLQKNMLGTDENPALSYQLGYTYEYPLNLVSNYKQLLKRSLEGSTNIFTKSGEIWEGKDTHVKTALLDEIFEDGTFVPAKIDYKSLTEYYVICMALGLVDSVLKNMNLKTWDGKKFYLAFYDMDTSLGKDNRGDDTDPLLFSDYWEPKEDKDGDSYILKQAVSYKDWSIPKGGYDVPSHYLFALAKYAEMVITESEENVINYWSPGNVWARMRSLELQKQLTLYNGNQTGCLRNADYFVDNFYKDYLGNIPDIFFNLNYRKKYLMLSNKNNTVSYNKDDFAKFSGRRIYYVRDWLNDRFRLLDLYFNIANVADPVSICEITKYEGGLPVAGEWTILNNKQYPLVSGFTDSKNDDISVLRSAFYSDLQNKYSNNIIIDISAENFSPLVLSGNVTGRYIISDNIKKYHLTIDCRGKFAGFGGSDNWTYVNNINPFILNKSLTINNDRLTDLIGTNQTIYGMEPQECSTWTLNTKSLKNITLTSPKYSGTLALEKESNLWTNLNKIDISNSKMGLTLVSVPVVHVNASNVKTSEGLTITGCLKINTLQYHNSVFENITLDLFHTDVLSLIPDKVVRDNKIVNGPNDNMVYTKTLYVACKSSNGEIHIGNQNFKDLNDQDSGLKEITLSGFKKIYIKNCHYLENLSILDPENVEILEVENPYKAHVASNFSVFASNGKKENTINLYDFIKLRELYFKGMLKAKYLITPTVDGINRDEPITFKNEALMYTDVETLDGPILFNTGTNTYIAGYSKFTLLNSSGELCDFRFQTNSRKFNQSFYSSSATLDTFKAFNEKYKKEVALIYEAGNMWSFGAIKYDENDLLNDLNNGTVSLDLSYYESVPPTTGIFKNHSRITAVHPKTFANEGRIFAKNPIRHKKINGVLLYDANNDPILEVWENDDPDNSYDLSNIFGFLNYEANVSSVTVTTDWLLAISDRLTNINSNSYSGVGRYKVVEYKDNQLQFKTEITPYEFFGGIGDRELLIYNIQDVNFHKDHVLNLGNSPFKKFKNLTVIDDSFSNSYGDNLTTIIEIDGDSKEVGFLYESKVNICLGSFGFRNASDLTIKYDDFIRWEEQSGVFGLNNLGSFKFNKTISSLEKFYEILYKLLTNLDCTGNYALTSIFYCCTVLKESDLTTDKTWESRFRNWINTTDVTYPGVKGLYDSFNNLKLTEEDHYWDWCWDIFKLFPKILYMSHTFANMKFSNSLPFNMFKTRYFETSLVYTDASKQNIGTYYQFKYPKQIEVLKGCFLNCTFKEGSNNFEKIEICSDPDNINSRDFILTDTGNIQDYYYDNNSVLVKVPLNSEFLDFEHSIDYHNGAIKEIAYCAAGEYKNPEISEDVVKDRSIVPTDIFYSCTNSADVSSCFAGSNLVGYIPDNLFKNSTQCELTNFLSNTLVIPKLYKRNIFNKDQTLIFDLYYYIPSNFIKTKNLDNAFNFTIGLPYSTPNIEAELNDILLHNPVIRRTMHIFAFLDSFPEATSIKNYLPKIHEINVLMNLKNNIVAPEGEKYNRILLNFAYDKESELETVILDHILDNGNYYKQYIKCSKLSENTYTKGDDTISVNDSDIIESDENGTYTINKLVSYNPSITILGKLGLKMPQKYCNYTYAIPAIWLLFYYGNVFYENINASSLPRSENNWVIQCGSTGSNQFGISPDAIFPSINTALPTFISNETHPYYAGSFDWEPGISKNQIENYSDSIAKNYNKSVTKKDYLFIYDYE